MTTIFNSAPCCKLELIIKAERLKRKDVLTKSDPVCIVYQLVGRLAGNGNRYQSSGETEWREVGRTERIRNTQEPEWTTHIALDYFFEERQTMKFDIWDWDTEALNTNLSEHDFLASLTCELAEIVSSGSYSRGLGDNGRDGTITIIPEEVDEGSREVLQLKMSAEKLERKDFFGMGKSDPYLQFYRYEDNGSKTMVHRTEFIKKSCNPNWQIFEVSLRMLCGGDKTKTIHIECWDNDDDSMSSHDFIGSCEVVVEDLIKLPTLTKPLINEKKAKKSKSYKDSGILICCSQLINLPTFVDFITGGTQLDFSVAIDFTASNGNPLRRDSLHFIAESRPNQYEIAIKAILDICQHYCNSKVFDAYGFGAKMNDAGKMIPIFSLMRPNTTLQDPSVAGVEGVMFAYKNCLHNVRLHGPTNFAPIINQAMRSTCEKVKKDGSRYHILLIITDGEICDMEKTKRAIIDATGHPLSIIIIGVGTDEFAKMEELDGDKQRLSVGGRIAERDIVQFVALKDFMSSSSEYISDLVMAKLAKAVLAEVPDQLTSYMRKHNIQPRPADNPWPRDREVASNYNAYFTGPAGAPQQPPAFGPNGQPPPPMGFNMPVQPNQGPYPPQQAPHPVQQNAPYPQNATPYSAQPYPSKGNGLVAPQGQENGFPYGAYQAQQAPYNYPTYVQPPHQQQVQVTASAPPVSVDDLQLEFINMGVKPNGVYPPPHPQNDHRNPY